MFRFINFPNQSYVFWNCLTSMIDDGVLFTNEENVYILKIIERIKYLKEMNWPVVYTLLINRDWIDCMINFVEEKEFKDFISEIMKMIIEMAVEKNCGLVG